MNKKKETMVAYAFLSPTILTFIIFIVFPVCFSLYLSFTEWNFLSGFDGIKWVGLKNFSNLLRDRTFMHAVGNTFVYSIATVPVSIIIAMALAYLLNSRIYLKRTMRCFFFIPYISSAVALAAVFKVLFRENGPINMFLLNVFHLKSVPSWFSDSSVNKIPIIIFMIWTAIGYELVVYMGALQNISSSYYEAADIDGANGFYKFMKITLPLLSPTTFYLVIVRFIAAFKLFSAVNIMTLGTPARSNTSIVVRIYDDAFSNYKFGYASAEALVLFVIILIITLINFRGQKKWVHY